MCIDYVLDLQVKAVRDTMNQMLGAWKEIPDVSNDVSPPPQSQSSSKGKRMICPLFCFEDLDFTCN